MQGRMEEGCGTFQEESQEKTRLDMFLSLASSIEYKRTYIFHVHEKMSII